MSVIKDFQAKMFPPVAVGSANTDTVRRPLNENLAQIEKIKTPGSCRTINPQSRVNGGLPKEVVVDSCLYGQPHLFRLV
jgi:hypothetical protein